MSATQGGDGVLHMCARQATPHSAHDTQQGGHADGDDSGETPGYPPESMFTQPFETKIEVKTLEPGESDRKYLSWRCQTGHQKEVKPPSAVKLQHATASVKPPAVRAQLLTDWESPSTSINWSNFANVKENVQ